MKHAWLALPVAALVALQWSLLDATPEKQEEARTTRMEELQATTMLPSYIASLFLGSFRAIAVDAAWLELDRAEKEKRFYRKKEILQFIKFLQPRNEEVHMLLAWNMMFNMPAIVAHRDRWMWEKQGLKMYREAMDTLPGSPFIRFQSGLDIQKKATPAVGWFEPRFIRMFMEDPEVQKWFPFKGEGPRTPFECSIEILLEAKDRLQDYPDHAYRSQGGLNCTDYFSDNLARNAFLYQAFYFRNRGVEGRKAAENESDPARKAALMKEAAHFFDQADVWFGKGAEFCAAMIRYYDLGRNPNNIVALYQRFLSAVKGSVRVELTGTPRQILDTYTPILKTYGTLDERYLHSIAEAAKVALSGDTHELNDREYDSEPIPSGEWILANIWPSDDIDHFRFWDNSKPFVAHQRILIVRNPGRIPLKLEIWHEFRGRASAPSALPDIPANMPADEVVSFTLPISSPGSYTLIFRSADPSAPETLESSYAFRVVSPKR